MCAGPQQFSCRSFGSSVKLHGRFAAWLRAACRKFLNE